jgi:hypothetical protein
MPPQLLETQAAAAAAAAAPPNAPLSQSGAASAGVRAVGESLPHAAGLLHTTGEAEYTDDAGAAPGTLHAWLVRAEQAPALLASVDATKARNAPGVAGVFLHGDLPEKGINSIGPVAKDELCFAEKEVLYVGQVTGRYNRTRMRWSDQGKRPPRPSPATQASCLPAPSSSPPCCSGDLEPPSAC